MTHEFQDILGSKLEVGDTVVVAFGKGNNSAVQRIGNIVEISDKDGGTVWSHEADAVAQADRIPTLVIQWDAERSADSVPKKPTAIDAVEGRFLKITPDWIKE